MRKLLLFLMLAGFVGGTFAQQRAELPKALRNKAVKLEKPTKGYYDPTFNNIPGGNYKSILTEEDIGNTWYDIATNRSMQTRIYHYDDGTMGAVWTFGPESNPTGNDRGTGYNYFDGSSWGPMPTASIENGNIPQAHAGWPSYTDFGENGEAYTCHHYTQGTILGTRTERGTGAWNLIIQAGPAGAADISFPRIITTGVDNSIIHILSTTWVAYNGQDHALLYARTTDAGATWEIENQTFDQLGSDYTLDLGGDVYDWAEPHAGVMAFLVGDNWMDLVLMKSTDGGDTWDKTTIWQCPYPLNPVGSATDTFYCPDGSHHLAIDNSGLVHVVFSLTRAIDDGSQQSYFPGVDGVVYWNENRPAFSDDINALNPYGDPASELVDNYSLIGWSQDLNNNGVLDIMSEWGYYNTGLSSQPQIVIDDQNQIFVIYSSVTEGFDNGTASYRHIWVRNSPSMGDYWGSFYDMNDNLSNIFDECVYPSAANNSDDMIYYTYQADGTPGASENGASPEVNYTRFVKVSKSDLIDGIKNYKTISQDNVSQNIPNPCNGISKVYVVLDEPCDMSLEVTNMMGQLVYQLPVRHYSTGKNELTINASSLTSGVYFYTVRSGNKAVTKKMMVE